MTPSFPTRRSSDLLVERGPHDERTGSAYAIVEGVDGRTHHLRFQDMEMTGDAKAGSIVELRSWEDAKGHDRLSLATRSDIRLEAQIKAPGATRLDRQLVARDHVATGNGFGREVRDALDARAIPLATHGLARQPDEQIILAQVLVGARRNQKPTTGQH